MSYSGRSPIQAQRQGRFGVYVHFRFGTIALIAGLCAVSAEAPAKDLSKLTSLTIDRRTVQMHGFLSEGFAYSNGNNYLTMNTSAGSFAMTDGGFNVSSPITDRFRVGAQMYIRNVGHLGNWHPTLD